MAQAWSTTHYWPFFVSNHVVFLRVHPMPGQNKQEQTGNRTPWPRQQKSQCKEKKEEEWEKRRREEKGLEQDDAS